MVGVGKRGMDEGQLEPMCKMQGRWLCSTLTFLSCLNTPRRPSSLLCHKHVRTPCMSCSISHGRPHPPFDSCTGPLSASSLSAHISEQLAKGAPRQLTYLDFLQVRHVWGWGSGGGGGNWEGATAWVQCFV